VTRAKNDRQDQDHEHGGVDWWVIADALVWTAVVVVAVLALEWLGGVLVRERIARGAEKLLKRTAAEAEQTG
jgi:hypothetical protein